MMNVLTVFIITTEEEACYTWNTLCNVDILEILPTQDILKEIWENFQKCIKSFPNF
jgi:hypothetical protein